MLQLAPETVASAVDDPTPVGIAGALSRLIAEGAVAPGERLPTVRDLAASLGVSPGTVSAAWQALASAGRIVTRGRAGSYVADAGDTRLAPHTRRLAGHVPTTKLDLSRGTPDPDLLPPLRRAFERAAPHAATASYHDEPVLPRLGRLLQERWPTTGHRITVVDGALDAIDRVLQQVARYGDRIVVEQPSFPPLLDLAAHLRLEVLPVPVDREGIMPAALTQALSRAPRALLMQPRAHNPTGVSTSPERIAALAAAIRRSPAGRRIMVIEDDHSGEIARGDLSSLAAFLPDQVVHVRSFSKSHGPDLRIAALGGPAELIRAVEARRTLGPWWTPRLIQHSLAELLTDGEAVASVARARATYAGRQRRFAEALRRAGAGAPLPADGINAWVPVDDERAAILQLATDGIRVAAGSAFYRDDRTITVDGRDRIRVTVGAIAGDVEAVADAIAAASRAPA
ncbi:PLP-dependent aminotransferase family protein [Microbacterium paludicola]|uniref:aminotransferase-like domain-containing protein n=1 Tax=Microbacterium paludicola TaxID=300019 RepID=UPI0031D36144